MKRAEASGQRLVASKDADSRCGQGRGFSDCRFEISDTGQREEMSVRDGARSGRGARSCAATEPEMNKQATKTSGAGLAERIEQIVEKNRG